MTTTKDYLEHSKQQEKISQLDLTDDEVKEKERVRNEISADVEAFLADKRNKIKVLPFGVSKDTPKDDVEKAKLSKQNQYNWGRGDTDSIGRKKNAWHEQGEATMRKARGEGL